MALGRDSSSYASQQLSWLDDMLAALSSSYDLRDLLQHLSTVICRIVPSDEAQLVLLTEEGSSSLYARTRDGAWEEDAGTTAGTGSRRCRAEGIRCRTRIGPWPAMRPDGPRRVDHRLVGALTLLSRDPQGYAASDLLHAQWLANYLGHGWPISGLPRRSVMQRSSSSARRSTAPSSCSVLSPTPSTSARCFHASRKLSRRCCRTTRWRWSSSIRTVISCARPTPR